MQLQPPAYESLVAEDNMTTGDDNSQIIVEQGTIHPVRRRPFSKSLRNRLNQIVSMYIPGNIPIESRLVGIDDTTDHTGLLSSNDSRLGFASSKDNELYDIKLVYPGDQLIKGVLRHAGVSDKLSRDELPKITSLAADHNAIYFGLENLPYVFLISAKSHDWKNQTFESDHFKGCLHLYSPGVGNILPHELCTHSTKSNHTFLYVVGTIQTDNINDEKKWILAKFDSSGQQIARSRIYSYQRYSGLSVDTNDNHLLLACPSINELVATSNVNSPGQICKLTPGFERRVFSITMGNESVFYKPNYVTQETAGHCCWASVERRHYSTEDAENIRRPPTRRLLAFPGRQQSGELKQSVREWLHAYSWDFADLKPCRIAAFDADRLLVVDADNGTLSYITWAKHEEKPVLYRITRPSSKHIRLLCSTYNSKVMLSDSPKNIAYFVAGSSIYSFSFFDCSPSKPTTTLTTTSDTDDNSNDNDGDCNNTKHMSGTVSQA
ncbi:hypothetical protein EWB00_000432 [Schistosoma japonicum]|uniref:DUF5736 domain-containing protein n=1 Tax=Schistosoma japonicum TaxID=6182 RepID=A0A4Z2DJ09_SCHJA|nr:hypothetical protein EWB00_000432 [Schistosoma japonicum]